MTEKQLIEGCRKREEKARKCLYEHYARRMFALCNRYVHDYDIAQDVLQEAFIKVFERIEGYSGDGALDGWISRICVNTALDYLRKEKKYLNVEEISLEDEIEEVDEWSDDQPEISAGVLFSMIEKLPKGYATVFNLLAVEEYSQKEVAEMLQITEGGVRSQYARARQQLIRMVKDYQSQNR